MTHFNNHNNLNSKLLLPASLRMYRTAQHPPLRSSQVPAVGRCIEGNKTPSKTVGEGFTFIELMLALVIMATTLGALFGLQSTIFSYLVRAYNRSQRIMIIKKNVMDRVLEIEEEGTKGTEHVEDPATTLDWSEKKIPAQGAYEGIENLHLIHVKGSWKAAGKQLAESMLAIRFSPPEEEQEKKQGAGK